MTQAARPCAQVVAAAASRGAEVEALGKQLVRTEDRVLEANERTGTADAARRRAEAELQALRSMWDCMEARVATISREAQSRLDETDGRIRAAATRAKVAERRSATQGAEIRELRQELKRCSLGLETASVEKQRRAPLDLATSLKSFDAPQPQRISDWFAVCCSQARGAAVRQGTTRLRGGTAGAGR